MSAFLRRGSVPLFAALLTGPVFGQVDCAKLPEGLQPRCALVNRMLEVCQGVAGEARQVCERDNLRLPTREDCTRLPASTRDLCEQHNRAVANIERCTLVPRSEREACARAHPSVPGARPF